GAVTFGVFYFLSIFTAAIGSAVDDDKYTWPLYVPAIGPFIALSTVGNSKIAPLLVLDGIPQCARLAMLIAGLANTKKTLLRNDLAKPSLFVAPVVHANNVGVGAIGTF